MSLLDDLGKLISRDATLVAKLGWEDFVNQHRGMGDFYRLGMDLHPAYRLLRLLRQYKHRVAPVVLAEKKWTEGGRQAALARGLHRSAMEHAPFIRKEFASMVGKGQWVVPPYSVDWNLPGFPLIPQELRRKGTARQAVWGTTVILT